jgi:nucleoside-diphosphate-sugar epimerase
MEESKKGLVLVTGVTGFLASQIAYQLLEKGYKVRGSVRSKANEKKIKPIRTLPHQEALELVEADLLKEATWEPAVAGCEYVLHVASPFLTKTPKNESDLIKPAVEGTMSVLKACSKHPVKHVVVTSSIAAVMSCKDASKKEYTESDWPVLETVPAYNKSKTLAEKEAWKFYNSLDPKTRFKLTVINPGYIFGPSIINTDFASGDMIKQVLTGDLLAIPKLHMSIVDVRDAARAHILAMEKDAADGQRYLCCNNEPLWLADISDILKKEFGKYGYKVTSRQLWHFMFKIASLWDSQATTVLPMWNKSAVFHNDKIVKDLGMEFIDSKEAVLKMAYSLIENGVVPDKIHKAKK